MKLSFEIKDDILEFSAEIGVNKISGTKKWGSEDLKFFLDAEKWINTHTMKPDVLTKADSVVREANEFIKNLYIAVGQYEEAAVWLGKIRATENIVKKPSEVKQ